MLKIQPFTVSDLLGFLLCFFVQQTYHLHPCGGYVFWGFISSLVVQTPMRSWCPGDVLLLLENIYKFSRKSRRWMWCIIASSRFYSMTLTTNEACEEVLHLVLKLVLPPVCTLMLFLLTGPRCKCIRSPSRHFTLYFGVRSDIMSLVSFCKQRLPFPIFIPLFSFTNFIIWSRRLC